MMVIQRTKKKHGIEALGRLSWYDMPGICLSENILVVNDFEQGQNNVYIEGCPTGAFCGTRQENKGKW